MQEEREAGVWPYFPMFLPMCCMTKVLSIEGRDWGNLSPFPLCSSDSMSSGNGRFSVTKAECQRGLTPDGFMVWSRALS